MFGRAGPLDLSLRNLGSALMAKERRQKFVVKLCIV
jgi:hypothetical protein